MQVGGNHQQAATLSVNDWGVVIPRSNHRARGITSPDDSSQPLAPQWIRSEKLGELFRQRPAILATKAVRLVRLTQQGGSRIAHIVQTSSDRKRILVGFKVKRKWEGW